MTPRNKNIKGVAALISLVFFSLICGNEQDKRLYFLLDPSPRCGTTYLCLYDGDTVSRVDSIDNSTLSDIYLLGDSEYAYIEYGGLHFCTWETVLISRRIHEDKSDTTRFYYEVNSFNSKHEIRDRLYLTTINRDSLRINIFDGLLSTKSIEMPFEFTFAQIHNVDISPNGEKAIVLFDLMPLMTREQIMKGEPTADIYKFVVMDLRNMTYKYFDADSACSSPIWGVFNSDSSFYICGNCEVEEIYINGKKERILARFNEDSEECGLFAFLDSRYLIGFEAFLDRDSVASTPSIDFSLVYFDKANDYERIVIDSGYIAPWGIFDQKDGYYYTDLFGTATASANIYRYGFNDRNIDTILTMNGEIFGLQIQ